MGWGGNGDVPVRLAEAFAMADETEVVDSTKQRQPCRGDGREAFERLYARVMVPHLRASTHAWSVSRCTVCVGYSWPGSLNIHLLHKMYAGPSKNPEHLVQPAVQANKDHQYALKVYTERLEAELEHLDKLLVCGRIRVKTTSILLKCLIGHRRGIG